MNFLAEIPEMIQSKGNLRLFKRDSLHCFVASTLDEGELTFLQNLSEKHVMLFIPLESLILRDQKDQEWEINLPKGKGQETLYSTTFFWNPINSTVEQILELAHQHEWAVYTLLEDKVCLLVAATGIAFNVNGEDLMQQIREG
ncbi:MAG: hypothetical protein AAFR59_03695 [Bacteroidota bacterium]